MVSGMGGGGASAAAIVDGCSRDKETRDDTRFFSFFFFLLLCPCFDDFEDDRDDGRLSLSPSEDITCFVIHTTQTAGQRTTSKKEKKNNNRISIQSKNVPQSPGSLFVCVPNLLVFPLWFWETAFDNRTCSSDGHNQCAKGVVERSDVVAAVGLVFRLSFGGGTHVKGFFLGTFPKIPNIFDYNV